jgi:hypothetical protein
MIAILAYAFTAGSIIGWIVWLVMRAASKRRVVASLKAIDIEMHRKLATIPDPDRPIDNKELQNALRDLRRNGRD